MEKEFSKADANLALDIIQASLDCREQAEFIQLVEKLKQVIGFSQIRCGVGDSNEFAVKKMAAFEMLTSFSEEWEERYARKDYYLNDNVALAAFYKKGLIYWADYFEIPSFSKEKNKASINIMQEAASVGLADGWLYSSQGKRSSECVIISLAGEQIKKDDRSALFLEYVAPHIGEAIKRMISRVDSVCPELTSRESEILSWIAVGKTAWEIAMILKISNRTVEFHTKNILEKLDAVNAQQAIAIAVSKGIISY